MPDLAVFVLRFGLGVMFTAHGLQMAFALFGGGGVKGFSEMLSGLGFAAPLLWAYVAAYVVLAGGLCLIVGLFTRAASFLLIIFMAVAIAKVHFSKGFFITNGGYEYNFVVISALIALMMAGPGKYSILERL